MQQVKGIRSLSSKSSVRLVRCTAVQKVCTLKRLNSCRGSCGGLPFAGALPDVRKPGPSHIAYGYEITF